MSGKSPRRISRFPQVRQELMEDRIADISDAMKLQDEILERVDKKLTSPILNGGFDDLVRKVDKIEAVTTQLKDSSTVQGTKIDAIHTAIYEPDNGLYQIVKGHAGWIKNTNKLLIWVGCALGAGLLGGAIKLLYGLISHIHYTP